MLDGDDNRPGQIRDGGRNRGHRGNGGAHLRQLHVELGGRAADRSGEYQGSDHGYAECRRPFYAKSLLAHGRGGRAGIPASPYAHSTVLRS